MPLLSQTITAAFFAVLKSGSAGATVRAALGDGATSVITAEDLKKTLPAAPFVALRSGPIVGARYDRRQLFFAWWVYDDEQARWAGINAVVSLIEAAYATDAIAQSHTDIVSIGQEIIDSALNRPARSLQYIVATRG